MRPGLREEGAGGEVGLDDVGMRDQHSRCGECRRGGRMRRVRVGGMKRREEIGANPEGASLSEKVGAAGGQPARALAADESMPAMEKAIALMRLLRSSEGCPWDREQSFDTIKRHTLEEVYEVFDAIERRAWGELRDELGDLLLQVLFYAQMADEAGYFSMMEVAGALNGKLIRRHPHVFGEAAATDTDAVLRTWEAIKREEKRATGDGAAGLLDDVPRSMPAVMEAAKLGSRAAKVGFDWPDAGGLLEKMAEEIEEVREELSAATTDRARLEEEIGDVLFTAVNLARHLKVDAEGALRGANAKFRRRFAAMEAEAGGRDGMEELTAEEWDRLWRAAKSMER